MITFICALVILVARNAKKRWYSLMCALPATFMSAVCSSYILMADEGFRTSSEIAYPIGICFAAACAALYTVKCAKCARSSV